MIQYDQLQSVFGDKVVEELKSRNWIVIECHEYDLMKCTMDRMDSLIRHLEYHIAELEEPEYTRD